MSISDAPYQQYWENIGNLGTSLLSYRTPPDVLANIYNLGTKTILMICIPIMATHIMESLPITILPLH